MDQQQMQSRLCLDNVSESALLDAWKIFSESREESHSTERDYLKGQAKVLWYKLVETKTRAVCCEKHGEGDFDLATLLSEFLTSNIDPASTILGLLDPKVKALEYLIIFMVGVQFGVALERIQTGAAKDVEFLNQLVKLEQPSSENNIRTEGE